MRALVTRGKFKGKVFDVSQWCNDWFTLVPTEGVYPLTEKEYIEIIRRPFSPASLAFTVKDFEKIVQHNNNGMLFEWYEPKVLWTHPGKKERSMMTFRTRK